ncbi:hypothetical protein ACE1TF_05890 [Geomicrobium sp. JSM 1781026]|uniref:hypothetical protein n=1 Tax=Geomicrobium sp. JSM 1781026 TaxID=3344580 RepID=UPI0035BF9CA0
MRVSRSHVQPQQVKGLVGGMMNRGKDIFLISLPGNIILLTIFVTLLFIGFELAYVNGFDSVTLNTLRLVNNTILVAIISVHVFYLFIYNQESATYWQQVRIGLLKTLKVIPVIIAATIVYAVFTSAGLALLIIPGILLYAYLGIYAQVIAFEGKGALSSLIRSRDLVKGSFWKVTGLLLSVLLLSNFITLVFELVARMLTATYPLWLDIIVYILSFLVIMPFVAGFYALLYFDLRSRQEAFDYKTFNIERKKIFA